MYLKEIRVGVASSAKGAAKGYVVVNAETISFAP
jgi:hypothetical protein